MKNSLLSLVEMAGDDQSMARGVIKAHFETFHNVTKLISESAAVAIENCPVDIPGLVDLTDFSNQFNESSTEDVELVP